MLFIFSDRENGEVLFVAGTQILACRKSHIVISKILNRKWFAELFRQHIPAEILHSVLPSRSLQYQRNVVQSRLINNIPESGDSNLAFTDVFMAIKMAAKES